MYFYFFSTTLATKIKRKNLYVIITVIFIVPVVNYSYIGNTRKHACTSEFKHTPKIAFYSHGYLHTEITAVNKDPVGFLDQCHGGLGPDRHPHEKS